MVERDHSAYPEKLLLRENPLAISSISASGTDAARRALAPGQGLGWGWGGDAAVPGGRGDNPQEGPDPRFAEVSRSQSRSCLEDVDLPRDFLVGFRGGGGGGKFATKDPSPGLSHPPARLQGRGTGTGLAPTPLRDPPPPPHGGCPGRGRRGSSRPRDRCRCVGSGRGEGNTPPTTHPPLGDSPTPP